MKISDGHFQAGTWQWDWTSMFTRACAGWRGRWRPWTTGTSPSAQDRGRWETFEWFLSDFNVLCCPGDKAGGHQDDPGGGDADAQGPVQQGQADRALQHHLPREDRPHRRQEALRLVAEAQATSSSCRRRRRPLRSLWWWAQLLKTSQNCTSLRYVWSFAFSGTWQNFPFCFYRSCFVATLSPASGTIWFQPLTDFCFFKERSRT